MKQLTCEMCGSTELVKQDGFFVCQTCGTKYSVEEAKKMMIEGTVEVQGTVKIDQSSTIANYLEMAKLAMEAKDADETEKYVSKILELDSNNYLAWIYRAKTIGLDSSLENDKIKTAIVAAKKAIDLTSSEKKEHVANELMETIVAQNIGLINIAKRLPLASGISHIHRLMLQWIFIVKSLPSTSVKNIKKQIDLCENMCNASKAAFAPADRMIHAAAMGSNNHTPYHITFANELSSKIKAENPNYEPPKKSGCYVATCVYGSYDCPQVWTLRRYRDDTLGSTWYGRVFIRTYYAISPTLVKWFGNTNWFKKLWKGKLDRMVAKLQSNGVEGTPYEDKNW